MSIPHYTDFSEPYACEQRVDVDTYRGVGESVNIQCSEALDQRFDEDIEMAAVFVIMVANNKAAADLFDELLERWRCEHLDRDKLYREIAAELGEGVAAKIFEIASEWTCRYWREMLARAQWERANKI